MKDAKDIPSIFLLPQKHKRVSGGHPWVYSNEIAMDASAKAAEAGVVANFFSHDKNFIGRGTFNPHTLIAGRIISRNHLEPIDEDAIFRRIASALDLRQRIVPEPHYRLIHAEGDGLPGLIVDRFGDNLCVQVNTAGMQRLWPVAQAALMKAVRPQAIVLRADAPSRSLEGLGNDGISVVYGEIDGLSEVRENGVSFFADLTSGQKTGWYFDQRDNHALVAGYASGARMLDLYCHAGGFGIIAAAKGDAAEVVGVDSSQPALDLAVKSAAANGVGEKCRWIKADVFEELERMAAAKEKFDLVVADPPPFVKSRKDLAAGARGYRKLARMAAQVTAKEGGLFIASCSHNMTLDMLVEEVAKGLREARREGRILYSVSAAPDHPVSPWLPESAYLKGLFLRLD